MPLFLSCNLNSNTTIKFLFKQRFEFNILSNNNSNKKYLNFVFKFITKQPLNVIIAWNLWPNNVR